MDGVVEKLEGLGAAADGGGGDVDAIVEEVVVELCQVLEKWVVLPVGAGLGRPEGESGVRLGLPYKNEIRSDLSQIFYFQNINYTHYLQIAHLQRHLMSDIYLNLV